ncbi:hypothetical protein J3B02_002931, partial [Coemansia erecta]
PGGPMIVLTPGEAEVSNMYTEYTHFTELAQQMGAMVVAIEHRFFGESNPLPDLSAASLKYMTLDNTLEDFAEFIRAAKSDPDNIFAPEYSVAENSTFVFTGGSYGGAIAAWMRAKYPDLVSAAWSSSAPVYSFLDFYQLDQAFGQHLNALGCDEYFAQAVRDVDEILLSSNETAIAELKTRFGMPNLANDDFAGQLANMVSSNINSPVTVNDDMVDRSICAFFDGLRAPIDSYEMTIKAIMSGYTPPNRINRFKIPIRGKQPVEKRDNNAAAIDISVNQVYRSWYYISCTWFADWQVPAPEKVKLTSYRSQLLTTDYWESSCKTDFGEGIQLPVDVASHNKKWFTILKDSTKIFYTVGELDPWRGSTVSPESGDLLTASDTVSMFVIKGATHTQDMHMRGKYDLVGVTQARALGDKLIRSWISAE